MTGGRFEFGNDMAIVSKPSLSRISPQLHDPNLACRFAVGVSALVSRPLARSQPADGSDAPPASGSKIPATCDESAENEKHARKF